MVNLDICGIISYIICLCGAYCMAHYQQKEQNYTKWDDSIWNSIEKEISLFQKKVTDSMLMLGDLSKLRPQDFAIQPCLEGQAILGEEFYIDMIRPFCVKMGYLPKKPPHPMEVEDIQFDEQLEREQNLVKVVEKKAKKGGKGKGGGRNDDKMKMQIVRDNFQKDIDLVLKSHSMERMQVEFGLKQRKLELKLITFFYVAFFIRKNKVSHQIDESEIFELINILIKIVRIFSHFQGASFSDHSQKIEVSPTLVLDIKSCIKSLREYYNYTNKTVIIKYPKLVYYTNYDRFFPTLDIKPYDSQVEFIQAVKSAFNERGNIAKPTFVFYRTMIGSGKTSASLALSQLIHECKLLDARNNNLQVLYSCLIGSVRVQVGRYCYNKQQKFALAAMQRSILNNEYFYPRIINSWSCRNEKIVDIVISDLHATYSMLDHRAPTEQEKKIMEHERKQRKNVVNRGKLQRENVILFVDQPTAFCKSTDSRATRKLFDILANHPPKLIVFASATMPSAKELPKTIELVRRKNPDLQVIEVNSKEFQIGCQYCSFKGEVIFPHTNVKNKAELNRIIDILRKNAFLLKLYTGPSLFFLLRRCEDVGLKGLPKIDELPEVKQNDITKATFRILEILAKQSDNLIEEVCALAKDETIMDFKADVHKNSDDQMFDFLDDKKQEVEQEEEEQKENFVNFKRMLKGDAHKFLGGCLIGTSDPIAFAKSMFERWVRKIKPIKRLKEKYDKDMEDLVKQIRLLEDDTEMREQKKTQKISKLQSEKEPKLDFPQHKKINTIEHYNKYCKNKEVSHQSMLIRPVPIENNNVLDLIEQVDDFILKLLFCGVAVYTQKGVSPKYLDKVEELASSNFLAFIITDQSLCYGTNFPISNVILTDNLVQNLNMNEMFQLIGRAGRVGQSWTARAFLEPIGLQKLNDYIHKPQNQVNDEGRIFEMVAEEHLRDPVLRLKNTHCEVRYLNQVENSEYVEMEVQKKDQDAHLIQRIAVVPFISTPNGPKYLAHNSYKQLKSYQFPSSLIHYQDLPTLEPEAPEDTPILDVGMFYKGFKEYLFAVADNTLKRILRQELDGRLGENYEALSHFKPKVYEPFYNHQTHTLTIILHCKVDENLTYGDYKFQQLFGNALDEKGLFIDRMNTILKNSREIVNQFRNNPLNVKKDAVQRVMQDVGLLRDKNKVKFYFEVVESGLQAGQAEYNRRTEHIQDKGLLEGEKELPLLMSIIAHEDVVNYMDPLFHISPFIRGIWKNIDGKAGQAK